MYQFVTARLKKHGNGARFKVVDISLMTLSTIFNTYSDGYIKLTNPSLSQPTILDFKIFKSLNRPMRMTRTFENWLQSLGNLSLPSIGDEPTLVNNIAKYSDGFRAQYNIQRVHPTYHPTVTVPESSKTDLLLSKSNVDMDLFLNHTIVTVNGLCHVTDNFEDKVRVIDGGKTCLHSDQNMLGIISFNEVASLERYLINESMLDRINEDIPYCQTVWVRLGVDLTNKSVILSLGGYLHINDNSYKVVNIEEGIIQINFETITMPKRIFESRKIIDLSSLELTESENYENVIALPELQEDEFIVKYLELSQTFVIVVDAPVVYVEQHIVEKTNLPGVYIYHEYPEYPLRLRSGIMPEYWPKQEYDRWTLGIKDTKVTNYHFETTRWQAETLITDNPIQSDPYHVSQAHLLEIGVEYFE